MFVLVVGAGRVGSAVATSALRAGHTVSVLDEDPLSHERLDVELGQGWEEAGGRFTIGTALEMDALVEAGIEQAQVFIASTNGDNTNLVVSQIARRRFEVPRVIARILDPRRAAWYQEQGLQTICPTQIAIDQLERAARDDEDNLLICQVAKEKYLCGRIIARVNNPRNLEHFKLLGIQPAVSATDLILRLIEHEVPRYGLVHLLDLPEERLEIIELVVGDGCEAAGRRVADLDLPDGALVISVLRDGSGFVPKADSVVEAGDEVLVVLDPGLEEDITRLFVSNVAGA